MRRGPSTRSTPSACPRPAPTSGPAAPPASVRGAPAGCGTPAIGCVPHGEPDIARIDLAGPLLDLAAWGTDPDAFAWFEAPPAEAVAAARAAAAAPRRPRRQRADAARPADAGPAAAAAAGPHPDRGGRRPRRGAGLRDPLGAPARAGPPRGDDVRPPRLAGRVGVAAAARAPGRAPDRGPGGGARLRRSRRHGLRRSGPAAGAVRRLRRSPGPAPRGAGHDAGAGDRDGRRPRPRERRPRRRVPGRARRPGADAPGRSQRAGPRREPRRAGVDRADRDRRRARLRSAQRPGPRLAAGALRSAGARRARAGARARPPRPRCWRRRGWRGSPTRPTPAGSAASGSPASTIDLPALVRQAAGGVASLADIDLARARAVRDGARARSPRADAPGPAERAAHARWPTRPTAPSRRPPGCRSCSGWPRRRASGRRARRSSCRCWRRTGGRCRPPATCAASGIAPIPRSGASCAAGIRGTRGPRIRGPRRPPRGPSRGRVPDGAGRRLTNRRPGHQSFANAGPSNRLRVRPARAGRRGRPYRGPDLVQCQPANRVRTGR